MAKKILLADDSVTIQKVVSITLAHEDFDLTIVDNGSKAVAKAKEIRPDVILLDVVMPDKDGYQVCQEIKGNAELRNIPIILLTGTFEPFDADRAAEVGADDFIKKPFESHTLINKVKEMAAKSGVPREKPVDISEVDIGFETPVEEEYREKPAPKRPAEAEMPLEADLETPWEDEPGATNGPSMKEPEAEDIWSVEEFEDISGGKREAKAPEKAARPPAAEKAPAQPEAPTVKGPAPRPAAAGKPVSDDFFVRDEKPREAETEGFELGEEISEDELEKFLDEERSDAEIAVEETSTDDDFAISGDEDEIVLSDEEGPSPRAEGRPVQDFEEDLLVENFEESPTGTFKGGRKEPEDLFVEESGEDELMELDWEDEPAPEREKAPGAVKTAGDFEALIRRTTEEELRDFTRESAKPAAERKPARREFEVDLNSFEEEPLDEEVGRDESEPSTFDFEDLTEEAPAPRDSGTVGGAGKSAASLDQKDVSHLVDKIAREVIEKVVWEVVPELAEELIKQEIKRLKGEKA